MGTKTKVLIVDDDARNIRILEEVLSDEFLLDVAANGETALEQVSSFGPDIVLLDVMMPGIDGLEVCRRIRKHDSFRYIKIILVSGKARIEERLDGYAAGADDYITKPFDHMELLAKVNVYAKLKAIEEVDRLKTDFLSLITHEAGTPLNAIIGFSSALLNDDALSEEHREMTREILNAGRYLHEKIDRILLLSALKKSEEYPVSEVFSRDLIDDAQQLVAEDIRSKDITVNVQQEENFSIHGNYQLLQKALVFLMENAVKFSPDGGSVAIREFLSEDKEHHVIQLEDSGPGFDVSLAGSHFKEFGIADIQHHDRGLGISLALTKLIVENYGGAVSAANGAQGGAVLTLSFPAANSRDEADTHARQGGV